MSHYTEDDDILRYWEDRYVEWALHPDPPILEAKDRWFEERFTHILPIPDKPRGKVLDYGCGNAMYSPALLRRFAEYVGVDTSRTALEIAEHYIHPRISDGAWSIWQSDGQHIIFRDDQFDCVLTITVLQHQPIDLRRRLINEIKRVLKPGGLYVGLEQQGNTQAYDMPPMGEPEWLMAWLPMLLEFDVPSEHPEWAADNIWWGHKP